MKTPIDVSYGKTIDFAYDGKPACGTIVAPPNFVVNTIEVTVETQSPIPRNSQLSIPSLPKTGGCGLASPRPSSDGVFVTLSIGSGFVDLSTIWK